MGKMRKSVTGGGVRRKSILDIGKPKGTVIFHRLLSEGVIVTWGGVLFDHKGLLIKHPFTWGPPFSFFSFSTVWGSVVLFVFCSRPSLTKMYVSCPFVDRHRSIRQRVSCV